MKKTLLFFLCLEILSVSDEISFDMLKTSALRHSHRLNIRAIDTKIEESRLSSIYSSLYPQLSLGYNGEYSKSLDSTSSSAGNITVGDVTISPNTLYKNSLALRLNYEVYHFGATLKQIEISEKEVAVKRLEECNEEVKLYQELLDSYVRAQKASSENRHKTRMYSLRQELYTLKQRLYTAGKESRVSVGDEAIRLIDLEREIERSKMTYAENIFALNKLASTDLDTDTTQLLPLDSDSNETLTYEEIPQERQYREKILQKNAQIALLQRSQLPTVSLYSNYYLYGYDPSSVSDTFNTTRPNSWNAGLSIRWSLFEGFKYQSEFARLRYELQRLEEEYALGKQEFDYENQTKQEHIARLAILTKNETDALNETRSKITMTQRLREQGEADAVSEMSVKLEGLERELTLESERIQHAYETKSLRLQHTEVEACTVH